MTKLKVEILGAGNTVTGSKYLLHSSKDTVLVDCGLFQGRKDLRVKNWEAPTFSARGISAITLTHAHIDHTGYLPVVVKNGFSGPIYATEPTIELTKLLLADSAYLQEEEARYANKKGYSKHSPAKPLYTVEDAERVFPLFEPIPLRTETAITPRITVTAFDSGHILGSASLNFTTDLGTVTFSGDVGRFDTPLLPDPEPLTIGDILLTESTYGNRLHAKADNAVELAKVLNKAFETKGPVIIPAFAVGRMQHILNLIGQMERDKQIPVVPVYVDSPMAIETTKVYARYSKNHDADAQAMLARGVSPLRTTNTTFCKSVEESKRLNHLSGPRIILSASGMLTGGRILHHIANSVSNPATTVVFVGYQAEGTRGRLLQSGASEIKLFGQYFPIKAKIATISGLSAHGDSSELMRWLRSCSGHPKIVKTIHGEADATEAFASLLAAEFGWNASPGELAEVIELG